MSNLDFFKALIMGWMMLNLSLSLPDKASEQSTWVTNASVGKGFSGGTGNC